MANEQYDIILKVRLVDEASKAIAGLKATLQSLSQSSAGVTKNVTDLYKNFPTDFAARFKDVQQAGTIDFDKNFKIDDQLNRRLGKLRLLIEGKTGKADSLSALLEQAALSMEKFGQAAILASGGIKGVTSQVGALAPGKARPSKKKGLTIADLSIADQALFNREYAGATDLERATAERRFIRNRQEAADLRARALLAQEGRSAEKPGGGFRGASARVLLWGSAATAIYGGISMIRRAISVTIDLENEMVQLQKVMSDTTPFDVMKDKMFELSSTMGVAIMDITRIAKIWAQQGYEMQQTLELTKISLDTMNALSIDAAQSTDYLTSVMRVWNVEIKDLRQNLAGIMKVQADYAIESQDLAVIFTRIGSGVKEAGDSMANLAGISTALRETTRKTASQIFTSLKTIYAKAFQKDSLLALEQIGVKTKLNETTFRSFNDVLTDLARIWNTLTDVERKNLAITLGQTRYWSDFVALMENFQKIAVPATAAFAQAWDEASRATQLQQKSLKNQLQGIASSAIEAGDAFGEKFFKPLVQTLSGPLKGLFGLLTNLPQTSLTTALLMTAIVKSFKTFVGFFPAYEKLLGKLNIGAPMLARRTEVIEKALRRGKSVGVSFAGGLQSVAVGLNKASGGMIKYNATLGTLIKTKLRVVNLTKSLVSGLAGLLGTLASWGAFFVGMVLIEKIINKLSSDKPIIDPFPDDVMDKLNKFREGIGKLDLATGKRGIAPIFSVQGSIQPLQELLDMLITLGPESKNVIDTYQKLGQFLDKHAGLLSFIKDKYGDITVDLEAQKKFWEDINTLAAIYNNLILKNLSESQKKVTADLIADGKEFFSSLEIIRQEFERTGGITFDFTTKQPIIKQENIKKLLDNTSADLRDAVTRIKKTKMGKIYASLFDVWDTLGTLGTNEQRNMMSNFISLMYASAEERSQAIIGQKGPVLAGLMEISPEMFMKIEDQTDFINKQLETSLLVADKVSKASDMIAGKYKDYIAKISDLSSMVNEGMSNIDTESFVRFTNEIQEALNKLGMSATNNAILFNYGLISQLEMLEASKEDYRKVISDILSTYQEALQKRKQLESDFEAAKNLALKDPRVEEYFKKQIQAGKSAAEAIDSIMLDPSEAIGATQEALEAKNFGVSENLKVAKTLAKEWIANEKLLATAGPAASAENIQKFINAMSGTEAIANMIKLSQEIQKMRQQFDEETLNIQKDISTKAVDIRESVAQAMVGGLSSMLEEGGKALKNLLRIKSEEVRIHTESAKEKIKIENDAAIKLLEIQETFAITNKYGPGGLGFNLADIQAMIVSSNQKLIIQKQHLNDIAKSKLEGIVADEELNRILNNINLRMDIWKDQADNIRERTEFIRGILRDSLTDFESIQRTAGKSVIFDTLGKIGQKFQEQQAEIFVNSLIRGNLGQKLLPNLKDIEFNEKLEVLGEATYNVIFSAFINGATAATQIFDMKTGQYDQKLKNYDYGNKGFSRTAASIGAIGNVLSNIGLGQIIKSTGRSQEEGLIGQSIGAQVGTVIANMLSKNNPYALAIGSILGSFGGGLAGIFGFGKKAENNQETMVTQLNMIEQNTARTADLMEKFINIPGSVFIPPQGGFVMNVTVNGNGDANQIAGQVINRIRQEFGSSSRTSGSRGYFLT